MTRLENTLPSPANLPARIDVEVVCCRDCSNCSVTSPADGEDQMPDDFAITPDWNRLPAAYVPATDSIIKHFRLDDLINLSNVSTAWRNGMSRKAFNEAAKAVIADRELGGSSTWPLLAKAGFSPFANELVKDGFRYAGVLINLQIAIDRLPSLTLESAQARAIAPVQLAGRGPIHSSSASEPEFLGIHNDGAHKIYFVSQQGELRMPSTLMGHVLPRNGDNALAVVNSMLSRGNEQLLVLKMDTGRLGVYRPGDDALSLLPLAPLDRLDCASISEDGRFVSVIYRDHDLARLVVFDRTEGRPVTNDIVGIDSTSVTVDSSGVALVAGHRTGLTIRPSDGGISSSELTQPNSIYRLSHDERHILRSGEKKCDIVLEDREGNGRVALNHPNGPTNVIVNSIAFSPANAMAALTYSDSSVAIFDLVGAQGDERLPSVHLQRPVTRHQTPCIASFEKDGTELVMTFTDWAAPGLEGTGGFTATSMSLGLVD